MRINYDREEDVLTIEVAAEDKIDHAEKLDSVIAHFTISGAPVLLEILDASEFLSSVIRATMKPEAQTTT